MALAILDKKEGIGKVDDDDQPRYFGGTALARWGHWSRTSRAGDADVVFFASWPNEKTFLGLGGSAYNLIGGPEQQRLQRYSQSGIQQLLQFLYERSEYLADRYGGLPPGFWEAEAWEAEYLNLLDLTPIRFVAERLLQRADQGVNCIIASPVYVERLSPFPAAQIKAKRRELAALHERHLGESRQDPSRFGRDVSPKPAPLERRMAPSARTRAPAPTRDPSKESTLRESLDALGLRGHLVEEYLDEPWIWED